MSAGVPVGTRLGRYEVVKHLARGGMADLSVARATGIEGFERHVVIKHLRPEQSSDAAFVQMFVTEARLAAALHHHNIVQVHDIGQEGGRHFFAMEYVHGEDVRRLLSKLSERRELAPLEHVVTIATAVAAALHHAHEQKGSDRKALGIVHRDVTPANIIVGYDGNVKVVDFGIAKAAALRNSDTGVGMLKGKVPYMAPEQCTGKQIDRRSDVFSLGIVLYELVTVRRLFKGGNEFFTMTAVVQGDIPKPSSLRKDLPAELEAIILKALARAPGQRYQSADEMRVALDRFADKANLRTSNTALADYMKKLFGERPEPWMVDEATEPLIPQVDFDKTEIGLAAIPAEAIESTAIPKSIAATRGSLIEQARLNAISSKLEPTPKPPTLPTSKAPPPFANGKSNGKALVPPPADPDQVKTEPNKLTRAALATTPVAPLKARATSSEETDPDGQKDPEVWMRVQQPPGDRARTDVDEKTDVSTPPPPPKSRVMNAVGPKERSEPTEIVAPLSIGDTTATTRHAADRRWLYVGGVAVAALLVAIVIMMSGRDDVDAPRDQQASNTKKPKLAPPPNAADPPVESSGTTTTYRPLGGDPTPKAEEPKPEPAKVDEPKPEPAKPEPAEPEPTITIDEPVKAEPVKTEPVKAAPKPIAKPPAKPVAKPPVTKPPAKPVAKPPAKPPAKPTGTPQKWDPDSLFLKPKK